MRYRGLLAAASVAFICSGFAFPVNAQEPASAAAAPPEQFHPEAASLDLFDHLTLEHRRYLVYLWARLNRTSLASALGERILSGHPGDKQTLLILASMHLERKNADQALGYARRLIELYPEDELARYHLAAAYYLAGQHAKAQAVLQELKQEKFRTRPFPYQGDLASSAYLAGDWFRAMAAYQELMQDPKLDENFRWSIRLALDAIYRLLLPQVSVDAVGYFLDSGRYWRTRLEHRQPLTDRLKLLFRWDHEAVSVRPRPLLRERAIDRNDFMVGVERQFPQDWTGSLSLGGSESGWVGHASAARKFEERGLFKVELAAHQPSPDGLLLQSLDGRRHRLVLSGEWLWRRTWFASGEIFGWETQVDRSQLGLGAGGAWNLEHILIQNRPNWRAGYRGMWMGFSRRSDDLGMIEPGAAPNLLVADRLQLLNNLAVREFHRHGLYLSWQAPLSGALSYRAMAGVDYSLDQRSIEHHASGGLQWRPAPRLELKSELGYTSSARTADQASQLWQINVAFKYWF